MKNCQSKDEIISALNTEIIQLKDSHEKEINNLRREEEKFRAIANYAASWEAWFNTEGRLIWMNTRSEELTGYTPAEYIASEDFLSMFTYPEDFQMVYEQYLEAIKGGSGESFEARVSRKNGSHFWASISWRPMLDSKGRSLGFRTSARDITLRKVAEEALKESEKKLLELNNSKDKFLSIIAHDLRSPFNVLLGLTDILISDFDDLTTDETKEILNNLNKTAYHTFNLLVDLLEWAKMHNGLIQFNPARIALKDSITNSLKTLSELAKSKSIEIINNVPDGPEVLADSYFLHTIIRNLTSNAIKFTKEGGKIMLSSVRNINETVVSVKDSGIGMKEGLIKDLFRIDANTKRDGTNGEHSNGLGLILCKEFVEKNGGRIWVESEVDKGTVFYFSVPNPKIPNIETEEANQDLKSKKPKVLLADDDKVSLLLFKMSLRNMSDEILIAQDGKVAIETCRNNPDLDLIVMDIRMPLIDGIEAIKQIRLLNKDVVIIAQTADNYVEYKTWALEAGCNEFLPKPFEIRVLMELVDKYFHVD